MLRNDLFRTVLREVAVFAFFGVLTVVMTWPLLPNLNTAVSGPGDPYLATYLITWDYHAAFHEPLQLFHPPIFYPVPYALALTEHMFGIALFGFPLFALGVAPLTVYNGLILLGFAFSGYGAYVLARTAVASGGAALAAGIFFAFVPFRFTHLSHLQHVWSGWLPILLAALILYDRKPSIRNAALFGAAFFLNGLANVHWLLFGSFSAACAAILFAAARGRMRSARFWLPLGASTAVGSALLIPFLLPYRTVANLYGMVRSWSETLGYSAHWSDWLVISAHNKLLGRFTDPAVVIGEHWLFPGVLAVVFSATGLLLAGRGPGDLREPAAVGAVQSRGERIALRVLDALGVGLAVLAFGGAIAGDVRIGVGGLSLIRVHGASTPAVLLALTLLVRLWVRYPRAWGDGSLRLLVRRSRFPLPVWGAILWVLLGLFGSVGLNGYFHTFLFDHVEVFRSIRVPARWAMITYTGLSVLVALGVNVILGRISGRWPIRGLRTFAAAAVCGLLLVDLRAAPVRWYLTSDEPAVYRWIATAPHRGAVLELPVNEGESEHGYMLRAATHRRAIINGVLGFTPKSHQELTDLLHRDPIPDEAIERLAGLNCSLVVVHADRLAQNRAAVRGWIRREIEQGRMTFVRRFDHDLAGDYVFALTAVEPRAATWRLPEVPDPAGRTPLQNAAAFLDSGASAWNGSTYGMVDSPQPWQNVRGMLRVEGWALSPREISSVNLRFANGRAVVPAMLIPRDDVRAVFPWYGEAQLTGWMADFEARPAWVGRETDVQVEVVHRDGTKSRLEDIWFDWREGVGLQRTDWNSDQVFAMVARNGSRTKDAHGIMNGTVSLYAMMDALANQMKCSGDPEFVDRLFRVLLDRPPDRGAWETYLDRLAAGTPRRKIIDSVIESEEFARRYLKPGKRMPGR